ncbi:MAG: DNA-processing protein DprA [Nautiliaceae bacterium]
MNLKIETDGFSLYYKGKKELLQKPKIAIIGSRKASKYSKEITYLLAKRLSKKFIIISGGALGIDTEAHKGSFPNTILVSPSSLDRIYPKSNETLIKSIYKEALAISEYENNFSPKKYTFIQRNRIIIYLSDMVIIPEAEIKSGSMRSFEWAEKFGKKVYVIPQRLGESGGTRYLAKTNKAQVIWDMEEFLNSLEINEEIQHLSLNEALKKYGNILYEMELEGKVEIKNGKVYFN